MSPQLEALLTLSAYTLILPPQVYAMFFLACGITYGMHVNKILILAHILYISGRFARRKTKFCCVFY